MSGEDFLGVGVDGKVCLLQFHSELTRPQRCDDQLHPSNGCVVRLLQDDDSLHHGTTA